MSMERMKVRLESSSPLLMHNARLANPLGSFSQKMSELNTAKKRKGADKLAVLRQMSLVEWEGGLYFSDTPGVGPVIPAMMLKACITEGAKLTRGGRNVGRCVNIVNHEVPLQYTGSRDLDALRDDENFRDQRMVKVGMVKVLRTRPKFAAWSVEFDVNYNTEGMERSDLLRYIRDAGQFEGIGDGRGKLGFGRFEITHINGVKFDESAMTAVKAS
jgi:hypothetical protein